MSQSCVSAKPTFLVIDRLPFRRACVATLLRPILEKMGFSLSASSPTELPSCSNDVHLALVVVGHDQVAVEQMTAAIASVKEKFPAARLLVLSSNCGGSDMVRAAFQAGAQGFLTGDMDPELVGRALDFVAAGGTFFSPVVLAALENEAGTRLVEEGAASADGVTARQQEVIAYLRQGLSNKMIARKMHLSEATVKIHLRHIMRRLGAKNRTQVAIFAASAESAARRMNG